jgi:hypothetical protein
MGVAMDFDPGPIIESPVRSAKDAGRLRALDPEEGTPFVLEAIRLVRAELEADRALIAFAGAPFTLFCYLVEGGGSKDFMEARSFLRAEPGAAGRLLDLLGESMARYLVAQARAGVDALMLFDSWVGLLAPDTYRRFALPVLQRTVERVRAEVDRPIIYFANGGATLLEAARRSVRRHGHRLDASALRGDAPAGARGGPPGEPRSRRALRSAGRARAPPSTRSSRRDPRPPRISSISATASTGPPIRTAWPSSSTACTRPRRGCTRRGPWEHRS